MLQPNAADEETRFRGPEGITYARWACPAVVSNTAQLCHYLARLLRCSACARLRLMPVHLPHSPPSPRSYSYKTGNSSKQQRVPIVLVAYEGDDGELGGLGVYRVNVGTA